MDMSFPMHRRGTALLAAILGAVLALAGCSTAEPAGQETTSATSRSGGTFPVTIETTRGEVTVNEKPERIVALEREFVELLHILDEEPISWGAYLMSAEEIREADPWESFFNTDPDPGMYNADYTINVEAVAAYDPDLILTSAYTDDQIYEQLSQIAPTYGSAGAPGVTWQDHLSALATLAGSDTAIVDEVVAKIDAEFVAARERLSGLQGATFQTPGYDESGNFWLTHYGNSTLIELGLTPGNDQPFGETATLDSDVQVSLENLDRLNADVLFLQLGLRGDEIEAEVRSALDADPRVADLPAKQNGTWIELTAAQWSAIHSGGTPASNRWFLDQIVPQLEASALNQRGR